MIKDLTIYTATGAVRAQITLNSGAKGKYTLGTDDYITLPFTLRDPVLFAIGDWVDLAPLATENGLWGRFAKRYIITEQPKPSWSNSTGGYDYDLRLDAYYMAWRTKIFKYLPKDGMAEASWDLTDTLANHLNVFIANLEAMGYRYDADTPYAYSIDGTVEDKALPLSYSNTNMVDALTAMAEAWECDWWMEEQTICFGRCEGGDEIDIEIGREAASMTRSDSSGTYANRIYVFGSDRNVPLKYRKSLIFTVTNSEDNTIQDSARHLKASMFPAADLIDATKEVEFDDWQDWEVVPTIPAQGHVNIKHTWQQWTVAGYCTFDPREATILIHAPYQQSIYITNSFLKGTARIYTDGDNAETLWSAEIAATLTSPNTYTITLPTITQHKLWADCNVYIELEVYITDSRGASGIEDYTVEVHTGGRVPQLVYTNPYPAARLDLTFLSGEAAGNTYTGTLNSEEDKDHENIITLGTLPVGTPFPAIGDTFTIDNIVSNDIPASWYTLDGDAVLTDGIVSDRLRLPAGYNYIDGYRYLAGQRVFLGSDGYDDPAAEEMPIEEAVEQVLINEDIYPRTETTVDDVDSYDEEILDDSGEGTGQYETFYLIHTDALVFSADYCIAGQTLGVRFTSGKLNGMEFEVNFNPDGKAESDPDAQWFEILANDDYGRTLPDTTLCPAEGDTFILYGWDSTYIEELGLVAAAEQELLDYAIDEMKKMMVDDGVYSVQLFPAWVYEDIIARTFDVGQRINLINGALFDDGRHSRVIGIEMALDIPYDDPTYSIGESQRYSRLGALEARVENISFRGTTYSVVGTTGDGSSVYLIKTNDSTAPTNSNAYSAQRSIAMFLRKDAADSTPYDLAIGGALTVDGDSRFEDTIIRGDISSQVFADGFDGYGWRLWNRGTDGDDHHLTIDSLTVRRTMTVYELLIQKIRAIGGQFIISAANGTIASAEVSLNIRGPQYVITLEDTNEFQAGDLMRCQTFTGNTLKSYWVEIDSVAGDYIYVFQSEFGDAVPEVGDEVVLCGNVSDTSRQSVIILSATEDGLPRIDLHDGVNSKAFSFVAEGETLGTLRVRTGKLDDITDDWFPADRQPSGYGLYGGNAYLRGTFVLADSGDDVSTLFQVIQGNITALITANEQADYLSNSTFANDMSGWVVGDGCAIVYDTLAGRNVLEMAASGGKTASMVQLSSGYAMQPTFDKDEEGNIIARNFNLQFYAYGAGADARFYMQGGDTTLDEAIIFDLREWTYYDIAFTAKSFGDFTMAVSTGTLHLRDVRIVADNVTYFTTLFSQTVGSITALTARIDNLPDQIYNTIAGLYVSVDYFNSEISNYVTSSALQTELSKYVTIDGFSALFASEWDSEGAGGDMHSALIAAFVGKYEEEYTYIDPDTGEKKTVTVPTVESGILLTADRILLEGYVSVNGGFTIDEAGNMTAVNGTFSGTVTADAGYIGGFAIANLGLEEDLSRREEGKSAKAHITFDEKDIDGTFMYLSSDQLDIEDNSTYKNSKLLAGNVASGIGDDVTVLALSAAPAVGIQSAIVTGISISVVNGTADDNKVRAGTHALLIENGDICGFRLRTRRFVNEDAYLSSMDSIAVIRCDSPQNVYLPEDAEDGQVIIVKHLGERDGYITIYAQGQDKISTDTYSTNPSNATGQIRSGQWRIFFYDSANNLWHMGITSE